MPADLLRFVSGPMPYSSWWLWAGLAMVIVVIGWYTAVFTWTLPSWRLRRLPLVSGLHARLIRRKYARAIRAIEDDHRAGRLASGQASAAMSRVLRGFLYQATGTRAQYMHVGDIADSELAAAAPLLASLNDVRFNTASQVDVGQTSSAAQELIRSWS